MANQLSPARECPAAPFEWSFRRVNNLYACIRYHKPVGVTRNFQMMFILDKFVRLIKNDAAERAVPISYETFKPKGDLETMTSDTIWSYLNILYDLETLNSNEEVPAEFEEEAEFSIDHDPTLVSLLNRASYPRSSNVTSATAIAEVSRHEQQAAANAAAANSGAEADGGVQDVTYVPPPPPADDGRSVASSSLITVSDNEARSASKSKRAADVKPQSGSHSKRSKKR